MYDLQQKKRLDVAHCMTIIHLIVIHFTHFYTLHVDKE